jgi:hypothetical protein
MLRLVFYFVSLAFVAFGCKSSAEKTASLNGHQKFYYPDGSLYLEGTYVEIALRMEILNNISKMAMFTKKRTT